jgi:hypothetical protein
MKLTLAALLLATATLSAQQSRWVHPGSDGKLVYAQSPHGDRIVDFSYAGYRGGGVAIPDWPATTTVNPTGADDTAAIQAALDAAAKLPLVEGHRGSVWLAAGSFHCARTLEIRASGIVLRGAGPTATTIEMTGEPHLALDIAGEFHQRVLGPATTVTDAYVPSGTRTLHVANAAGLHAGDTLLLVKPATAAWMKFMGMDHLVRPGVEEKWVGEDLKTYRKVSAVEGNTVTLEVPLTDNIDMKFLADAKPTVSRVEITGLISETGLDGMSFVAPKRSIAYQKDAEFDGVRMANVEDAWIRSTNFENTTNSVRIESGTARITVKEVKVEQELAVTSAAKNFQFSTNGTQILLDRISGKGDSLFYVATQARQQGPVVVLHCTFLGDGHIEPHQRWSTGLLVDGCKVPGGGIDLMNRGTMGSGHGWTIGWSVLWNNTASEITVQQPPGAANWSIGDRGEQQSKAMPVGGAGGKGPELPRGIVESAGKPVQPESLYLQQLRERLGEAAVKAIGYE